MPEVAQIKVEIQMGLIASISPILESALAIFLELATNIIKHAKASLSILSPTGRQSVKWSQKTMASAFVMKASDKDLHLIRERIALLGVRVEISHQHKPTR